MNGTILLLLVVDVSGIAVVGIAARVPEAILSRSQLDTIVYRECLCPARRWGAHRGHKVLLCCPHRLSLRPPSAYET